MGGPARSRTLGVRRPAHRHSRRAQRVALVVVVPRPVKRVLELRPRTPLGLADALLALVVHPERVAVWFRHDLDAARFLPPNASSPAGAAPKRPSLRPGAFKVAFQKIHSPDTTRASGWASSCRPPRPTASCGLPLASATCEIRLHACRLGAILGRSCCCRPAPSSRGCATLPAARRFPAAGFRPAPRQLLAFFRLDSERPARCRCTCSSLHRPLTRGPPDTPPCECGLMAGAQRFRFRDKPCPGADGAVLEVRVPQVRAAAPTWKRPLVGA